MKTMRQVTCSLVIMDLEVEFAEDGFAFLVDQFEGVTSVAVHPAVSVGRASI